MINKLANIGISAEMDNEEAVKVRIMNLVMVFLIASSLFVFVPFYIAAGEYDLIIPEVVTNVIFTTVLVLHHFKKFTFTKVMILCVVNLIVLYYIPTLGKPVGMQYLYIPLFSLPMFFLNEKEKDFRIFIYALTACCMLLTEATDYQLFPVQTHSESSVPVLRLISFGVTAIVNFVIVSSFYSFKSKSKKEISDLLEQSKDRSRDLLQSQEELQQQQEELQANEEELRVSQDELTALNARLEAIVRERTKELDDKVEQLRHTQNQVQQATFEAELANQSKTQFLANMSHEIRTPLNGILGFSQILMMRSQDIHLSLKDQEYLENIRMSGENLGELINNILDLSKIESGKVSLSVETLNLKQLFNGIYHINKVRAVERDVNFNYEYDPKLPDLIVSDRTKLNQILMNLVSNAIKFTPEQKAVSLTATKVEGKQEVTFTVKDDGIGIAEDRLEEIFKPFEQADNTVTREFGGTGLGLAITQEMVHLLKGKINVQSELGQGSVFSVTIPYREADVQLQAQQHYDIEDIVFEKNNKVLVVEDNKLNQDMLEAMFEQIGLDMYLAENGKVGVKKALELEPDLILMDMHMPVMGGIEATRHIREHNHLRNIPIIALSADAFTMQQREAFGAGVNQYLTKPVDFDKLFPVLVKYLKTIDKDLINEVPTTELPSEIKEKILQLIHQVAKTPIFETKIIVKLLNEVREMAQPYISSFPQLTDKLEDAAYNGDEDTLQELIKNADEE